ncbi:hypothetical protein BG004_003779 [Podila humilis]|nr:hypothetical protein BG004_003779 [Podila humilis]
MATSAKNPKSPFKALSSSSLISSSGASVYTAGSSLSQSQSLEPTTPSGALSRHGSLFRSSSNGTLRRSKSVQKKTLISKVFADESEQHDMHPDLSMEMTLLVVKRCVKEIRERGLTTKGILRQVQMGQSKKQIMDTIKMILDDDASTELSALHQIDIHLVVQAMKFAIRYSEQTLVTYADYEALYLEQDRNFIKFVHDLPATNRAILLDLFSLCADVTLLAHLNNMTLVAVAKAISLSIMAEPEREFTTFDASLQQRNMWGAACEDLLRSFLRIKTSYDLAKIEQEDDVDENRYVDNLTRVVKSARQRSGDNGPMPSLHSMPISLPSSAASSLPGSSAGWPSNGNRRATSAQSGYFDLVASPRSASPLSHQINGGSYGPSLTRSNSFAPTNPNPSPVRPMSPATSQYEEDITEYEEMMQDRSHLNRLRQPSRSGSGSLKPMDMQRRRSSVADMESLYMLPAEATACADGYDSEPEMMHHDDDGEGEVDIEEMNDLIPDFSDGLGWDFSKEVDPTDMPSLASYEFRTEQGHHRHMSNSVLNKAGVIRSNSSSSNGSGMGPNGPIHSGSPRTMRDLSKQQFTSMRMRQLHEQRSPSSSPVNTLNRSQSQQDAVSHNRNHTTSSIHEPYLARSASSPRVPMSNVVMGRSPGGNSPSQSPHFNRRNPALRRSISLDPHTMNGRIHKKATELRTDILARELALQTERALVEEDIRMRLLEVRDAEQHQEPSRASSEFSLQSSPHDLERPVKTSRGAIRESNLSISTRPKSPVPDVILSDVAFNHLSPLSNKSTPFSNLISADGNGSGTRTFEVVSRPREIETQVHFSPVSPLSPRSELRSKFQESFPERPISPPPGYIQGRSGSVKRSPAGNSSRSVSSSNLTSSPSSASSPTRPPKHAARALSPVRGGNRSMSPTPEIQEFAPRPLQIQQVAYSSAPVPISHPSPIVENKPKGVNFIRALSHKLRSQKSDDQLKPVRINNQGVGPNSFSSPRSAPVSAPIPALTPLVTIELPRLELDFLGGLMGPEDGTKGSKSDLDKLPLSTAPASMMVSGPTSPGGAASMESWRREAQALLPVSAPQSSTGVNNDISAVKSTGRATGSPIASMATERSAPIITRPRGFTGGRRSSATGVYVGGNSSTSTLRDQQQRRKIKKLLGNSAASSPVTSPVASPPQVVAGKKSGTANIQKRTSTPLREATKGSVSDSSYTTDDSTIEDGPSNKTDSDYLPKTGATLLKAMSINSNDNQGNTTPSMSSSQDKNVEKTEYQFSAATLVKDGKLYYQLQWDEFSELGFKSDFFSDPEQYLSGVQKSNRRRLSKTGSGMTLSVNPSNNTNESSLLEEVNKVDEGVSPKASTTPTATTSSSLTNQSLDRSRTANPNDNTSVLGQLSEQQGQDFNKNRNSSQDLGPSPEQRAAAFKAAQESFKALAKDPRALAALKAQVGSSQIISTGSFSTQTSKSNKSTKKNNNPYPSPEPSPRTSVKSSISSDGNESSLRQRSSIQSSVSDRSLATTVVSEDSRGRTQQQRGSALSGGGGAGALSSLSSSGASIKEAEKQSKKKGFFSKKSKVSKKNIGSNGNGTGATTGTTRKRRLLPVGVRRQDVMTKTEESLDEVFPWMLIEHMAGQESGWVMLEPVQDGAVGWVKIDKLEEEVSRLAGGQYTPEEGGQQMGYKTEDNVKGRGPENMETVMGQSPRVSVDDHALREQQEQQQQVAIE